MQSILIETDLSTGQANRFKSLFKNMKIENGRAYLLIREMHGALLTNSRQSAANIVKAHSRIVKPHQEGEYLRPSGVYVLLEALCDENPAKALGYRAATALIAATLANNPELARSTQIEATRQERLVNNTIREMKRKATCCTLSGVSFNNTECHIHHIEGKSEQPDLADVEINLIPLAAEVHLEYHAWVTLNNKAITRKTLKEFAGSHNYRTKLTA
jgi:hypothetical protein